MSRTKLGWIILLVLVIPGSLAAADAQARPQPSGADAAKFRVNTHLVPLTVTVTDSFDRPILDLTRDDFEVFEDKISQEIAFFSFDSAPLAIGLLLDSSASMRTDFKMERARAAALHFVRTSHRDDEVFLVDFDSRAALTLDFSTDLDAVAAALSAARADGRTALNDAVYLALEKLNSYQTDRRKVILLITDGADTASRRSVGEIAELAREANVQIYAVGICSWDTTPADVDVLSRFAEVTGGRAVMTMDSRQMVEICYGIAIELHQQYSLAYRPTNEVLDGKWRKVQVKVKRRKGMPRPVVRARQGYYARGPQWASRG